MSDRRQLLLQKTWQWLAVDDALWPEFPPANLKKPLAIAQQKNEFFVNFSKRNCLLDNYFCVPEKQSVVLIFDGTKLNNSGLLRTCLEVGAGAHVTVIEIYADQKNKLARDLHISVKDHAACHVFNFFLNAAQVLYDGRGQLLGAHAQFDWRVAYSVAAAQNLDVNYVVMHSGPKSKSLLHATGVLATGARKICRQSTVIPCGVFQVQAQEKENVLLCGAPAVNKSVPAVFSHELTADVKHGLTVGEIDEKVRFYAAARGLSADSCQQLLARERLLAVARRLPVFSGREAILARLEKVIDDDGR